MSAPKTAQNWSDFKKRDNHAGHIIGVAQITDPDGVFIPGLTLEIEVKATIVSPQCLFQFSLRQKRGKLKEVVYQLEVTPQDKRSHNGLTPIYGPHEHIGDSEPRPVTSSSVNCDDWDGCLAWFLGQINVSGFQAERPC
jgi:hypothetical protein